MHGARSVLVMAGPAVHLEQQINAIEGAVADAPGLAADLARTLVETVCKTILTDRGTPDNDTMGFKDLLGATYDVLELAPDVGEGTAGALALKQLLRNLDDAILGISLLRHAEGVASHGKDAYVQPLEELRAEFAARAADALVCFLYKSHRQALGVPPTRLVEYEDHGDLNDYIDSSNHPVRLFGLQYQPSEVLYYVDREAYLDLLVNFSPSGSEQESNSS
jgi:hypothetical protein